MKKIDTIISVLNETPANQTNEQEQFSALMKEISYGIKQLKAGEFNLADYWYHLAEFYDDMGLPADAQEHRDTAKVWILGIPGQGKRKTGYINVGRRDVGIRRSIEDCE